MQTKIKQNPLLWLLLLLTAWACLTAPDWGQKTASGQNSWLESASGEMTGREAAPRLGFGGLAEEWASGALVAAKEATTVIGRVKDLENLAAGEKSLLDRLPNLGNPKANWAQNSGVLRDEMGRGLPIRDASPGDIKGQFLNAERNLLESRGWKFDTQTNFWNPPK